MIQFKIQFKQIPKYSFKKYSFNRVQDIQWNYSFKKNEENYSKFPNEAKIWQGSPPEAPEMD